MWPVGIDRSRRKIAAQAQQNRCRPCGVGVWRDAMVDAERGIWTAGLARKEAQQRLITSDLSLFNVGLSLVFWKSQSGLRRHLKLRVPSALGDVEASFSETAGLFSGGMLHSD